MEPLAPMLPTLAPMPLTPARMLIVVSLLDFFFKLCLSYLYLDDFEAVSAGSSDGNDSASVTAVASTLALAPVPITSAAPVTPAPAPIAGPSSFMDPSTRFYVVFVGRRVGVYTAW